MTQYYNFQELNQQWPLLLILILYVTKLRQTSSKNKEHEFDDAVKQSEGSFTDVTSFVCLSGAPSQAHETSTSCCPLFESQILDWPHSIFRRLNLRLTETWVLHLYTKFQIPTIIRSKVGDKINPLTFSSQPGVRPVMTATHTRPLCMCCWLKVIPKTALH